jgi:hypothetical protein
MRNRVKGTSEFLQLKIVSIKLQRPKRPCEKNFQSFSLNQAVKGFISKA